VHVVLFGQCWWYSACVYSVSGETMLAVVNSAGHGGMLLLVLVMEK
jgi:hypothetical protein